MEMMEIAPMTVLAVRMVILAVKMAILAATEVLIIPLLGNQEKFCHLK
jgi:hypothetical protein